MKITILGAGNVATQLALGLRKAGHTIVQVYNRSDDAGQELAKTVGATFTADARKLLEADVFLVAVKDDAIADVASQVKLSGGVIAHTSGTKTAELLSFSSGNYGVFYPLQTMSKLTRVNFADVPVLIEGSTPSTLQVLENLALSLSKKVHRVDETQRQWIHVAAVFANNFSNHMYAVSEHLLAEHGLGFEILKPLILRSVENMKEYSPAQLQTGPAMRNDRLTIEKHIELLSNHQRLQKVYEILTDSIMQSKNGL